MCILWDQYEHSYTIVYSSILAHPQRLGFMDVGTLCSWKKKQNQQNLNKKKSPQNNPPTIKLHVYLWNANLND